MAKNPHERFEIPSFPAFDEEYFEWIDLLEAVVTAHSKFTMIELGAGYGRWLANAWAAVRAYHGSIPCKLIGVEPEPTHYEWMKLHFEDNRIDFGCSEFIQAAASDEDGQVWFYVGRPDEWYGQAIAPAPHSFLSWFKLLKMLITREATIQDYRVRKVRAVGLIGLLDSLDHVDLIDLDVQGAELIVLKAAAEQLDQKVKRIHIGTHGEDIEFGLRSLFQTLGWSNLNDYPSASESNTPWGVIKFQDGVQSWINPKLANFD